MTTAAEFRQALARLDLTQTEFARLMRELGDPRSLGALRRSVSNWRRGVYALPPELSVILGLLPQVPELDAAIRRSRGVRT